MADVFGSQGEGFIDLVYRDALLGAANSENIFVPDDKNPFNADSCTIM